MIPTALTTPETDKLQELAQGRIVLELGADYGASTLALCQVAKEVHTVDWFKGDDQTGYRDARSDFFRNTLDCSNLIVHIGDFRQVFPSLRPGCFNFLFLDGHHSQDSTVQAYVAARQLLRHPSVVCFHDYGRFGVTAACDSLGGIREVVDSLAVR